MLQARPALQESQITDHNFVLPNRH